MAAASPARAGRRPFPAHPPGWRIVETAGAGPFVSRAVYEDAEGRRHEWTSRRHRLGLGMRVEGAAGAGPAGRPLGWWAGLLFVVGAACFALASVPAVASRVDPRAVGVTYAVGAVFFTSAASVQHLQTLRAERALAPGAAPSRRGPLGWLAEPRRIDWWTTAVQLVGTVFFNVTTIAALNTALDTPQQIARVWAPDAAGSVCFLVASYLAVLEACHRFWCRASGDVGRRIARLNLLGSVFFGISAVTSYIVPDTGEELDAAATDATTFLGAVCFLAGAVLLMGESRSAGSETPGREATAAA